MCQVQGTASAGGGQQSQQMWQPRLRTNNCTRGSNVLRAAVEKLGTEPGVLAPSPVLTAPHQTHRCCSLKPQSSCQVLPQLALKCNSSWISVLFLALPVVLGSRPQALVLFYLCLFSELLHFFLFLHINKHQPFTGEYKTTDKKQFWVVLQVFYHSPHWAIHQGSC